jgi:serine/threonine protein kinase
MPANELALTAAIQTGFPNANISCIGCGGFACTFRVMEGADDLAIKVIDPQQVGNPVREEREVVALQTVSHPCVVPYRGTGTIDYMGQTYRYLKMDFVEGQTLKSLFAADHFFSADELATLAEDIVSGAIAIWGAGLAHRDLSPNNVLVKADGHAVIVDLGLARQVKSVVVV